jgi:succinate dehydrogenase / fumarate reductase flavoprotein subunit
VDELGAGRPEVARADVEAAVETALAPLERAEGENPYEVWHDLQTVMQDLVGIIRRKHELEESLKRLADLRPRVAAVKAPGGRRYNPGWHLALDLRNMLVVSECTAKAALEREESRGGHTREDFPAMDPKWRKLNLVCGLAGDEVTLTAQPVPAMRLDLLELFERSELAKYLTDEELAELDAAGTGKAGN